MNWKPAVNKVKNHVILFLLFVNTTICSQTPYPLSFYWNGDIPDYSPFEIKVNLLESDKVISGKGSKLKGICVFTESFKRFPIEGEIKNNDLFFNCLDTNRKIVQSFIFPDADGRNKSQNGKWTDAKITGTAKLKSSDNNDLPKSYTSGFSVAVNLRFKTLAEDSIHKSFFNKLPKIPYQTTGEGYMLEKVAYQKASYYGKDFLEFSDTIFNNDQIKEINNYVWQILPSKNKIPYILEVYSVIKENELKFLSVKVLNFIGAKWTETDRNIFPDSTLINQNSFKEKPKVQDIFICDDKIIFYSNNKKPFVWHWKEEKFILE